MKTNIFYLILLTFPLNISVFGQSKYDILINEFMAYPKATNGLPNAEYIELYNASTKTINLHNWKIVNGNHRDTIRDVSIKPDSFLLIHGKENFTKYGKALLINKIATLSNPGDEFILINDKGDVVDAVRYDISTYQNTTKAKGGWSLERINPKNPCLLDNWIANNGTGGTPCKRNSVYNPSFDTPTFLQSYYFLNSKSLFIAFNKSFNEPILKTDFSINNGVNIIGTPSVNPPFFNGITLIFDKAFDKNLQYDFTIKKTLTHYQSIPLLKKDTTISLQYPTSIDKDSLIINEVLINPETGHFRYIELFNLSKTKAYDLDKIKIVENIKGDKLDITLPHIIFPNNYAVITENPNVVANRYGVDSLIHRFLKQKLMAWGDDKGDIILMAGKDTLDRLTYDKTFHSPLLANTEGVALERINPNNRANDRSNWQSAAKTVGYGTPGYKNSQFTDKATPSVFSDEKVSFHLEKTSFSPNEDGIDDYLTINYKVDKGGYITNISVYDANGHFITHLEQNTTIALEGEFRWHGETKRRVDREESVKIAAGFYIIYVELLSLEGGKNTWKLLAYLSNN
jgi:hypothetical protein